MSSSSAVSLVISDDHAESLSVDSQPTRRSSITKPIVLKDRFGFYLSDEFHQFLDLPSEVIQNRKDKETARERKWITMMKNWEYYAKHLKTKNNILKRRIRKGIPDTFRGKAWSKMLHAAEASGKYPNYHKIDLTVLSEVTIDEIERDIDRTFPRNILFIESNGHGQSALRRMLQSYAALDQECGYCQGMGFIAGLLLTYMVEEDAFNSFYAVLMRPSAPLRLLYLPKLVETQKILFVFGELGEQHLGPLWTHLQNEGMHPTMYFTEWLMTMFCRGFSFDLVTRVWDIFLAEGSLKIVYRVSLAILKYFESKFMSYTFEKIMALMRELPKHIDASAVMTLAWRIPLTTAHITQQEKLYAATLVK